MKQESFNNLIDHLLVLEENPELRDSEIMFRKVLSDYFFKQKTEDNKNFLFLLEEFTVPDFIKNLNSLIDVNIDEFVSYVNGEMVNDSLCGQIMLSKVYLKAFYSEHPPSYSKLPSDVKMDLIGMIKDKNGIIISAFEKIKMDMEADKGRKIEGLVALILKNIFQKTARPLNKLEKPANEIIEGSFPKYDEIFTAAQGQIGELTNDANIKSLVKLFFKIKKFDDIIEISDLFKAELDRYIKRAKRIDIQ